MSRNRPTDYHTTRANARAYDRAHAERSAPGLVGSWRCRVAYGRDGAIVREAAVIVGVEGAGEAFRVVLRGNGSTRRVSASTFAREWFAPVASDGVLPRPAVLAGGVLVWPSAV